MTIMQKVLTPGQPSYWAIVLIPNVAILIVSLLRSRRNRAFALVALCAVINIVIPYGYALVFNNNNGLGAPGTPEWVVLALAAVWTNQGTLILLLAFLAVRYQSKTSHGI